MSGLPIPKIRGPDLLSGTKAPSTNTPAVVRTAMYAAANRLTDDWTPVDSNVNDIILASSPAIRKRVR
ncbi:MAG: hypothetical protein V1844_00985 [Pseudomonadota bacterium]